MVLCVPCDRPFPTQHALEQHLQSQKHWCEPCNRFFKSVNSKKQHTKCSKNHRIQANYDVVHNKHPSASLNDRKMGNRQMPAMKIMMRENKSSPTYIGVPRNKVMPVFKMACHLRFENPDVNMLLSHIETQLDHMVISALIEAALRLLPPDDTPEGRLEAKERMQRKMERAHLQEVAFVDQVRKFGYQLLTESEQKNHHLRSTPDIRFIQPVSINGQLCHWIEFKNSFGFKSNPFIAAKNKKQLQRYSSELGSGAVVYKLGFEIDHIVAPGIHSFREEEVLDFLGQQLNIDTTPVYAHVP